MFHMTNSGLNNVWLKNGYKTGEDKFGPYYSINDIPGLYGAITVALAHGGGDLSAAELRVIRRQLGMTQAELGNELGCKDQTVLLWERRGVIPEAEAKQIKFMILRQFCPEMKIEAAFRHIEQPRPQRLVMSRENGCWDSVINNMHMYTAEQPAWSTGLDTELSNLDEFDHVLGVVKVVMTADQPKVPVEQEGQQWKM